MLLECITDLCSIEALLYLKVENDNESAIKFYEKFGFKISSMFKIMALVPEEQTIGIFDSHDAIKGMSTPTPVAAIALAEEKAVAKEDEKLEEETVISLVRYRAVFEVAEGVQQWILCYLSAPQPEL
ncbi:hypothetical protein K1719_016311 [Acacia pycnantha]|nr:hypothetical protein K1719_016311 [Acacia pycnantha]